MNIYLVVGLWEGIIEDLRAFHQLEEAERVAETLKSQYEIDEEQDPALRTKDVLVFTLSVE